MSISGIHGAVSSGYSSGYGTRSNAPAEGGYGNLATGPDTVSFSETALKMAQSRTASSLPPNEDMPSFTDTIERQPDEAPNADKHSSSLTTLGKNSLFSMLLENLFFAELEESAASNSHTAQGGNEQAGEEGAQRQQQPSSKSVSPLEDGGKVAELKKILNDVATGKTSLSDLPKVMAGSGGTQKADATSKSTSSTTAKPDTENTNAVVS